MIFSISLQRVASAWSATLKNITMNDDGIECIEK